MDTPKLSIIIVNWNTKEMLRQCLTHIFKRDAGIPIEVIVVDNASTDGSPATVEAEFPCVHLFRNTENLGFSKANNPAMPAAQGEYVLLLNSDTIVKDNALFKKWVSFMDDHRGAGASGCRLVNPDGTHQVGDGGFRPCLKKCPLLCHIPVKNFSPPLQGTIPRFRGYGPSGGSRLGERRGFHGPQVYPA